MKPISPECFRTPSGTGCESPGAEVPGGVNGEAPVKAVCQSNGEDDEAHDEGDEALWRPQAVLRVRN